MSVAVSADSNSGITQEEGERLNIHVLPMPFMLNGQVFFEDVDLSQAEFYERLAEGADISTSQPSPEAVMKHWENLLSRHDQVVHIPMSSGLSSACHTASMLAEEFDGKVQVVNNQRVSVTQRQSAIEAVSMAGRGMDASFIRRALEETRFDSSIYIMVDTLKYLKKGGRITPAAAALGTLLKLKPVLSIFGDKLDAFSKARTVKQAKSIMIGAVQKELSEKYQDETGRTVHLQIAHSNCEELALEFKEEVAAVFPQSDLFVEKLALSIACHTGPGALALAWTKKMDG